MIVTPYNRDSYLVTSRTREGIEHLVDLSTGECSCEGMLDFGTTSPDAPCAHVEAAIAFKSGKKLTKNTGGSPFAFLQCQTI